MASKSNTVVVLKFGSSVLRSENDLPRAVHEIYRWWREGAKVIAVVSAFGDTTNRLARLAENICSQPEKSTVASLLATGETTSSALLGLALNNVGIPARVLDAAQVGLRTVGARLDADPVELDSARLWGETRRGVVVLPGFVGRGENGDTTLLGRGGSDYSALFLAQRLKAHCVLLKDVDGLYTSDPSCTAVRASRFERVSYDSAIRLGGSVVQQKAVRFAAAHRLTFTITSIGARTGTEVGPFPDRLDPAMYTQEPLRVILLGCGTVGGGVYQRLAALPELFTVVGVGARTASRATEAGVPDHLFTSDLETLIEKPCDVVVELIGDTKRAAFLIERALHLGRNLVTANKTLIAHAGDELHTLAAETGATLCYSSAVGGVLPALETIKRVREVSPLRAISGVLNGTTNFILDQLAIGQSFGVAVKAAQERGYAEQDPQFDLDGIDAAQKLIILVAAAFDQHLALHAITRNGIRDLNAEALKAAQERGQAIRLVARCVRSDHGLEASVQPVELPLNHPFAQIKGAQNCLLVEPEVGERVVVSGEGAGRWPTTESVIADLFEIRSNHQEEEMKELEECVA